jgi:hypothetical protein
LLEYKLKIFRWKLLQFNIPTKSYLLKWKISTDSLCNVCKVEENYDHFFMSCKYLDMLLYDYNILYCILYYHSFFKIFFSNEICPSILFSLYFVPMHNRICKL